MTRLAPLALALLVAAPASAQTFRRPVACSGCIANWYYFDRTGSGGGVEDWNCGTSSYDGHRGTDFSLAGGNPAIDAGHDIVAAADGMVVSVADGFYDHCRTCSATVDDRCGTAFGFGFGNHVVINHGSYRVVYGHMRTGSVRPTAGATVRCGDVIGQIGSSGCTTGAHLHYETRPFGGSFMTAFDSFAGSCSATSPSTWESQGSYRGLPGDSCDGAASCPSGTFPIWTCISGDTQRQRCISGVDMVEDCPYGCDSMPTGTDDVCAPAPDVDGDGSPADVDCDDMDSARYPGAMEVCGDGVDQDCDGSDLTCPGTDAGVPQQDAAPPGDGAVPFDAATSDAGTGDAGTAAPRDAGPDGRLEGTCACRAGSPARTPWGLFVIALLSLAIRARR